jgi:hypothetical protein
LGDGTTRIAEVSPHRPCRGAIRRASDTQGADVTPVARNFPTAYAAPTPVEGEAIYSKWRAPCYDPAVHHPATNALTVEYQGVKSSVVLEWTDPAPDTVKYFVRNGISVMAGFRKTGISDAQLDALADYVANAGKQKANADNDQEDE